MNFDNRVFNVNGHGSEGLLLALKLAFLQQGGERSTCKAWSHSKKHGLILHWWESSVQDSRNNCKSLPVDLDAEGCLSIVEAWLSDTDNTKDLEMEGWDANCDHDGHNSMGWRVFCEDWGQVNDDHTAICAIKPAYMWIGK